MSGLKWFRAYSNIVDDDKLRLLAFEDRWHFVALCALKCSGLLDEPDSQLRSRKIAVKMGVQVRELEEISRRLQEVGLVDKTLNPCKWDELQFKSDTSTDRVKKYREKQRVSPAKRDGNVSVTAQETDTESEVLSPKGDCSSGDELKPEHFVESWNSLAPLYGLPAIRKLTPERRVRLRARIAGYSIDEFREVLGNIERSPFLRGERGWKGCTFDWVTKKANFQKILEGNYG